MIKKIYIIDLLKVKIQHSDLSGKRDSNPRPLAWEANALPTELLPHGMQK